MHRSTRHNTGFTLIELMAAMAIMGLMLFLINELFQNTSAVVTRSVQTSKIIATTRVINEQFLDDANAMVGPDSAANGGYLVIYQQRLTDVKMIDPFTLAEVTVPELRSDQIAFIRNANGMRSTTPSSDDRFGTSLAGQSGDVARVWYGHPIRTAPDGTRRGNTAPFRLGGASAKLDSVGVNFILGRQALLFNPTDMFEVSKATPRPDPTVAGDISAYTYADNAFTTSRVRNSGVTSTTPRLYMGYTDVTVQPYGPASDSASPSLLYRLTHPSQAANHRDFYLRTIFVNDDARLGVNTNPTNFSSASIAQSHGILAQSCSEIIIDFAADLNGNGRIDTVFGGGNDTTGAIWWYDGLKQTDLGSTTSATPQDWEAQATVQRPLIVGTNGDVRAFVFRADDDAAFTGTVGTAGTPHSYWPYLVRMRYRLHDTRGRFTTNNPAASRDGLDNDGDGVADEANGDVDEDKYAGRWVEHIIRIPRP